MRMFAVLHHSVVPHHAVVLPQHVRLASSCASCSFIMQGGASGEGFEVQKYGDGRVALIGFPSGAPSCCSVVLVIKLLQWCADDGGCDATAFGGFAAAGYNAAGARAANAAALLCHRGCTSTAAHMPPSSPAWVQAAAGRSCCYYAWSKIVPRALPIRPAPNLSSIAVGKSTLLTELTGTSSEAAGYGAHW